MLVRQQLRQPHFPRPGLRLFVPVLRQCLRSLRRRQPPDHVRECRPGRAPLQRHHPRLRVQRMLHRRPQRPGPGRQVICQRDGHVDRALRRFLRRLHLLRHRVCGRVLLWDGFRVPGDEGCGGGLRYAVQWERDRVLWGGEPAECLSGGRSGRTGVALLGEWGTGQGVILNPRR